MASPLKTIGASSALGRLFSFGSMASAWISKTAPKYNKAWFVEGGSKLTNLDTKGNTWGKPIPITWGIRRLSGELLWASKFKEQSYASSVKRLSFDTRPKFKVTLDYFYTVDFAVSFGYAPSTGAPVRYVNKLWASGAIIYDRLASYTYPGIKWRFYDTAENKLADVAYVRLKGADAVPFRGQMVVVFEDFPVTDFGSVLPTISIEIGEDAVIASSFYDFPKLDSSHFYLPYAAIDWQSRRFYSGIDVGGFEPGAVVEHDLDTREALGYYAFTGQAQSFGSSGFAFISKFKLLVGQIGSSNSRAVYSLDVRSGTTVATFGNSGGGLDHSLNEVAAGRQWVWSEGDGDYAFALTVAVVGSKLRIFKVFSTVITSVWYDNAWPWNITSVAGSQFVSGQFWVGGANRYIAQLVIDPETDAVTVNLTWADLGSTSTIDVVLHTGLGNQIVVFYTASSVQRVALLDLSGDIVWSIACPFSFTSPMSQQSNLDQGTIHTGFGILDLNTGSYVTSSLPVGVLWDSETQSSYSYSVGTLRQNYLRLPSGNRMSLSTWIREICVFSGYNTNDIIIIGVNDTIDGALILEPIDLKELLSSVCALYRIEMVETGGKIKFFKHNRGVGAFVANFALSIDDLALVDDSDDDRSALITTRSDDESVPYKITLRYIDPDMNYQENVYEYQRPRKTNASATTQTIAVPIVMRGSEAASLVGQLLYDTWSGKVVQSFRLPQKFAHIDPGDVVSINHGSFIDTIIVSRTVLNGDRSISCYGENILTEDGIIIEIDAPTPFEPDKLGRSDSELFVFDTPLLVNSDDTQRAALRQYLGLAGATLPWTGGYISRALSDSSGTPIASFPSTGGLTWGRALTIAGEPLGRFATDDASVLRLSFGGADVLDTVTQLDMLNGSNRAFYGRTGRWEIIGFRDVSFDPVTKQTTLTGLLRGLRGTENNIPTHAIGDFFVVIDDRISKERNDIVNLSKKAIYLGIGDGAPPETGRRIELNLAGAAEKPYAPVNHKAGRSGSDIVLTWERRDRLGETLKSGVDTMPMSEIMETYDLEILNVTTGALLRTVNGLAVKTFTYTSAQQSTDGLLAPIPKIRAKVYQNSSLVGHGFTSDVTVDTL